MTVHLQSEPTWKRVIKFYDVRQPNTDNLNQALCTYNWSHLTIDRDIGSVCNAFRIVIEWHINMFVPHKQVTLSSNTPSFVTPLIKSLLRKRNKLMRFVDSYTRLMTSLQKLIA